MCSILEHPDSECAVLGIGISYETFRGDMPVIFTRARTMPLSDTDVEILAVNRKRPFDRKVELVRDVIAATCMDPSLLFMVSKPRCLSKELRGRGSHRQLLTSLTPL